MPGYYLKLGHKPSLPHTSQLSVHFTMLCLEATSSELPRPGNEIKRMWR